MVRIGIRTKPNPAGLIRQKILVLDGNGNLARVENDPCRVNKVDLLFVISIEQFRKWRVSV